MPVEPTKKKLKRRSSRCEDHRFDPSHGRELELKRNRGEVSCAECRRLKIKCDKQIPCQSCQRRGCSALCPNGSLATGQGTRFVLAATEHLHRRIAKLSGRIRQLEDALADLHSKHSTDVHPLLHEDMMQTDERDESDTHPDDSVGQAGQNSDIIDAFGTLSISEHGISRFFGPTGGSESLLLTNLETSSSDCSHTPDSLRDSGSAPSVGDLSLFSEQFPFTPMGQSPAEIRELVEGHLPTYERALAFCDTYFEQVAWVFRGVTRTQLVDDMLPVIYKRQSPPFGEDYTGPHDLALLFKVMAIAALVCHEPSKALGEHYHQISKVAMSLQQVLEKPSIVTIQTLHLGGIYNAMSDHKAETSIEMTWSLGTLASHLSQTIGLHRDSARWGLTPKMVQQRRVLFWDLFVTDAWQSLFTGRPPSFSLAFIDCGLPQYDTNSNGKDGSSFGSSFEIWQSRFAAECIAEVTSRILTAEAPSYATIMELDRKVREFPLPEGLSSFPDDLAGSFQKCCLEQARETVLMYLHRSFFAQAIIDQPVNPLKSTYAPSFLAAYRASSTILKMIKEQFNLWPSSCSRFWMLWTAAFSAAVVFGTVVTRGPRSPLAQPAMAELEQACILFSKASLYSARATRALAILTKLNEKARNALSAAQRDPSPVMPGDGVLLWNIKKEDIDDELSILAGHTRLVSTQRGSRQSSPSHTYNPSPPLYHPPAGQLSHHKSLDSLDHLSQPHLSSNVTSAYAHMQHTPPSLSHAPSSITNTWVSSSIPSESRAQQYQSTLGVDERLPSHYTSYITPTGHHEDSMSLNNTYGWSNDPRIQQHTHTQSQRSISSASSSSSAAHQLPPQHQSIHPHQSPGSQHQHHNDHQSQYHAHSTHPASGGSSPLDVLPSTQHSHVYPSHSPTNHQSQLLHDPSPPPQQQPPVPPVRPHDHSNVYSMYGPSSDSSSRSSVYHGIHPQAAPAAPGAAPNMELANLGMRSRDSRLDERQPLKFWPHPLLTY